MGVPLVRRLGSRLPLRDARAHRPARSPRASSCCCCASGTCTRTGRSRPTNGTSPTSTRRCTPGRRCRSSSSTAAPTSRFLARIFHKLLINFTWWVDNKDHGGNNLFQGGFMGLDNIAPLDRSTLPPSEGYLEQADSTAWMAMYALDLLEMALRLAMHDRSYEDVATKFFEHFLAIAGAANNAGLWDEQDCLLLRRAASRRRHRRPDQGEVAGRPGAGQRGARPTTTCARPAARTSRPGRTGSWRTIRNTCASVPHARHRRRAAPAAGAGAAGAAGPVAGQRVRRRRAAVGLRHPGDLGLAPRASVQRPGRRHRPRPSTTSRPNRPPSCSAATPTGAARSGCAGDPERHPD